MLLGLLAGPPTWRLPVSGHVNDLVAASIGAVREVDVDGVGQEVHWVSGSRPGRKRIRLNRKKPCTPPWLLSSTLGHVFGRDCIMWDFHIAFLIPDQKRRRSDQANGRSNPAQVRTGVG